ncbi:hypothetical protein [uncultured Marinobacter sp.]|uniref:hypothetical protein n=1 Tax=uncultured Marinobacter sp. TaxID=187379 RepID=UPI00258F0639|nr:hypothetical protein [uncultured Marinobacter sp.]
MRVPAECDHDADLVLAEAAVRLDALRKYNAELQDENDNLRKANQDCVAWEKACKADLDRALARADACQREAQIWKQEARTQSAIVAEIYQELTGKTGEPGGWNGARPLRPAIFRKQAEAVDEVTRLYVPSGMARTSLEECANRLRQQADELEKVGEHDA